MKTGKKSHLIRNVILALIGCGIAGLILTAVLFFRHPSPTCVSATIEFSFEGAADGIAPNGAHFDIREMASDNVLLEALVISALNEKYSVEQIRPHLVLQGSYPEDMATQVMNYESLLNFSSSRELNITDYHPTTFSVVLYNDFDPAISEADLRMLLDNILITYRKYFTKVYSYTIRSDSMEFDLENYDYPQQLDIIQTQLELLQDYAEDLYTKKPFFRFEGRGFNDIVSQLKTMIESDVSRISADLTINALTRNTARLLTQYQFEIRNLNNQVEKQTVHLEQLDALVASYEKNEIIYLSTNDALTKIDGNSSETYDVLVDQRKEVADQITLLNSQITDYQLKMADLLRESSGSTPSAAAQTTSQTEGGTQTQDVTKTEDGNTGNEPAKQEEGSQPGETASGTALTESGSGETVAETEEEKTAEIAEMSEEELAEAAEEAEKKARRQVAALRNSIDNLVAKKNSAMENLEQLLNAYNEQEINEATMTVSRIKYDKPEILSGAFIKKAIMTAGPVCAVGFILCMIAGIHVTRKKEKEEASAA